MFHLKQCLLKAYHVPATESYKDIEKSSWVSGWSVYTYNVINRVLEEPRAERTTDYCLGKFEVDLDGHRASQVVQRLKKIPHANAGDISDVGSIPGSGRSPGGGHGNPLQYSCLENSHGQRSLVGYPMGSQRVRHDWSDLACNHAWWI